MPFSAAVTATMWLMDAGVVCRDRRKKRLIETWRRDASVCSVWKGWEIRGEAGVACWAGEGRGRAENRERGVVGLGWDKRAQVRLGAVVGRRGRWFRLSVSRNSVPEC